MNANFFTDIIHVLRWLEHSYDLWHFKITPNNADVGTANF